MFDVGFLLQFIHNLATLEVKCIDHQAAINVFSQGTDNVYAPSLILQFSSLTYLQKTFLDRLLSSFIN